MKSLKNFIYENNNSSLIVKEELDDNLFWLLDKWFERNEHQQLEFIEIIVKCKETGDKVNIDELKQYLKNTSLEKNLKEFINFLDNDLEPLNNKDYLYALKQVIEVVIGKKEKNKYLENNKEKQVSEKLVINKNTKIQKYNYHPKSTTELRKILWDLLEKRGENANLNDIDTSNITFMDSLFSDSDFNGDISKWDVSNVEDMDFMFYNSDFNGDISNWDVSKVEHMRDMFLKSPLEKNPPSWYKNK